MQKLYVTGTEEQIKNFKEALNYTSNELPEIKEVLNGEIYPRHQTKEQHEELNQLFNVQRELTTVYNYLIDSIPTAKDQNQHADKCRAAEKGIKQIKHLITVFKNR